MQNLELIKEVVKDITALIRKNAVQSDWYKKDGVKAQTSLSVKNTLRRKGTKAELKEILDEIMEQAHYKEWDYRLA
nr:type I restriction enzyme endonuclease domain-containing protein [Nafulsella turpanensis]